MIEPWPGEGNLASNLTGCDRSPTARCVCSFHEEHRGTSEVITVLARNFVFEPMCF